MIPQRPTEHPPINHFLSLLTARNLRDLGGLPTRSRRVVARGRFFRSSALCTFEPNECSAVDALNLRTVFDLRATVELEQPNSVRVPGSARGLHLPLFEKPRDHWIDPRDKSPTAGASRYYEMLCDGLPTLAKIVLRIAEQDTSPFLVHCAVGRDRTGIVVGCLLDLLDVRDDAIATDYALSDPLVNDGHRAQAATMLELLGLIRAGSGSTQELLRSQGVSEATIGALRRQLLTDAP